MKKEFKYTLKSKGGKVLLETIVAFGSKENPFPENWKDNVGVVHSLISYKEEFINSNFDVEISENLKFETSNEDDNDFIHFVVVCTGESPEDYTETNIFATNSRLEAIRWRNKFNKIIENNYDRIVNHFKDGNYNKPKPFCYDKLIFDKPSAKVRQIKYKEF